VILIKAGLNGGSDTVTTTALPTTARTTTQAQTSTKLVLTAPQATASTTTTETTTPGAEYYTVQSGDTLGSIAQKYGTTVDELAMLNPGIDPAALRIGQRIRVK
jgi:LysM repeat protein